MKKRKFLSFLLTLCMVVNMFPVTAFAEVQTENNPVVLAEESSEKVITGFKPLEKTEYELAIGTKEADVKAALGLPKTVTAVVGEKETKVRVNWVNERKLKLDEPCEVVFAAELLDNGYIFNYGVAMPKITVKVTNIPVKVITPEKTEEPKAEDVPQEEDKPVESKEPEVPAVNEENIEESTEAEENFVTMDAGNIPATYSVEGDFTFDAATGTITGYNGAGGDVVIPETINGKPVTAIDDYVFSGAGKVNGVVSIVIPKTVTVIGANAFNNNDKLTTVNFAEGSNLETISGSAFVGCVNLSSINLPDSLKYINESAFAGCGSLKDITIPKNVISIGDHAFYQSGLINITFASGSKLESIDDFAFENSQIVNVSLPSGIKTLGTASLGNCPNLETVILPKSVTSLGWEVFGTNPSLKAIYYKGTEYDWNQVTGKEYVPSSKLKYINPDGTIVENGIIFNLDTGAVTGYRGTGGTVVIPDAIGGVKVTSIGYQAFWLKKDINKVVIPASVTLIGNEAFSNCGNLSTVEFKEGSQLKEIGVNAFMAAGLSNITLPASLEIIGNGAFAGCGSLKDITIPKNVKSIEGIAFMQSALTNITFEEGSKLSSIGKEAFRNTNITEITVPNSVTKIEKDAFWGGDSIKNIYYKGTEEQWNKVNQDTSTIGKVVFIPTIDIINDAGNKDFHEAIVLTQNYLKNHQTADLYEIGESGKENWFIVDKSLTLDKRLDCKGKLNLVINKGAELTIPGGLGSLNNPMNIYSSYSGSGDAVIKFYRLSTYGQPIKIGRDVKAISNNAGEVTAGGAVTVLGQLTVKNSASLKSDISITVGTDSAVNGTLTPSVIFEDPNSKLVVKESPSDPYPQKELKPENVMKRNSIVFQNKTLYIGAEAAITDADLASFPGLTKIVVSGNLTITDKAKLNGITVDHRAGANVTIGGKKYSGIENFTFNTSTGTITKYVGSAADVVIPEMINGVAVTSIGIQAFESTNVQKVIIPSTVTSIGERAFITCGALSSVDLPDTLENIGKYAFYECTKLTNITIPKNVTFIGDHAFTRTGLTNITFAENSKLETIDAYAFESVKAESITLPEGLKVFNEGAFISSPELKNITIPVSVTFIGSRMFVGCDNLTDITYAGTKTDWSNIEENSKDIIASLKNVHFKPATVTLKVVNGTWGDISTADKTVSIDLNSRNNGEGKFTAEQIPTDMIANKGYGKGKWTPELTVSTAITADTAFTYTFGELQDITNTGIDFTTNTPAEKTEYTAGEGTVTFDPVNNKVILDNAAINKNNGFAIRVPDGYTIELKGENTVQGDILGGGKLDITSGTQGGKLNISSNSGSPVITGVTGVTVSGDNTVIDITCNNNTAGIYSQGEVKVTGGTVNVNNGTGTAIKSDSTVNIAGGKVDAAGKVEGTLTVDKKSDYINKDGNNINIGGTPSDSEVTEAFGTSGTITVLPNADVKVNGDVTVSGTVENNGNIVVNNGGSITNNGTINNNSGASLENNGTITNNGTIENKGTGSFTNNAQGEIVNSGVIKGSNVTNNGAVENKPNGKLPDDMGGSNQPVRKYSLYTNDAEGTSTISITSGAANSEVSNAEDLVFTVAPEADFEILEVKYRVGSGSFNALTAVGGSYTVPKESITGDISILVLTKIADSAITENPSAKTVTYNKEAQDLVNPGIAKDTFKIKYKLSTEAETAWKEISPKAINAGDYTVQYKAVYGNIESTVKEIKVSIAPKPIAEPAEITTAGTYDGTEKTYGVKSTADYTVTGGTQTDANAEGHTVTIALKDKDNTVWKTANNANDLTYKFKINPKEVTITAAVKNKVYDGNNTAEITSATLSANYDGENLKVVNGTATFDNKNVGTDKTVTFAGFTLGGTKAANYKLTAQPASVTADITALDTTISGITAANRDYNAEKAVTISGGTVDALIADDVVTVDLTNAQADMADKNVGTGKPVTVTGLALSGADAGNYHITTCNIPTVDIAKIDLGYDVSGLVLNKQYNGTNKMIATGLKLTGAMEADNDGVQLVLPVANAVFADEKIGNNKDVVVTLDGTVTGPAAINYNLPDANAVFNLKGNITEVTGPEIMHNDDIKKRVVEVNLREALTTAPYETLANNRKFDSPEKIENILRKELGVGTSTSEMHDYQYQEYSDAAGMWIYKPDVTTDFIIPYPEKTNERYRFKVAHMKLDGTVEVISDSNIIKDEHGLIFENVTTSPFLISWKSPPRRDHNIGPEKPDTKPIIPEEKLPETAEPVVPTAPEEKLPEITEPEASEKPEESEKESSEEVKPENPKDHYGDGGEADTESEEQGGGIGWIFPWLLLLIIIIILIIIFRRKKDEDEEEEK